MNDRNQTGLLYFSWRRNARSLTAWFRSNSTSLIFTFGPSSIWKVRWTSFGPPAIGGILWVTVAAWNPFSCIMSRMIPSDLPDQSPIDERIEPDRDAGGLQRVVDLRPVHLLRPGAAVVDDLHPLALLHVVGDDLADRPVGEGVVLDVDPEVVEEVGAPEALEVLQDLVLVVRHPHALRRPAGPRADVVEVGLWLDDRRAALRLEARCDEEHHRRRMGRRLGLRHRHLLIADGERARGRRGWRRRGGRRRLAGRRPMVRCVSRSRRCGVNRPAVAGAASASDVPGFAASSAAATGCTGS